MLRRITAPCHTRAGSALHAGSPDEFSLFGKWTAEYVAMRAPDALPAGDLALRRVLSNCSARELDRKPEAWRSWRAYAVMLLWQSAGQAVPSTGETPPRLASTLHQRTVKSSDAAAAPFVRAGSARSRRIA